MCWVQCKFIYFVLSVSPKAITLREEIFAKEIFVEFNFTIFSPIHEIKFYVAQKLEVKEF